MSSTYTTNLHLEKPADGDASWGTAVRASLDFIDDLLGTTILWGLVVSTAGSSSSFAVAAGQAGGMALASSITKTTGAWAVGSGNGSLDVGTVANATWYFPYLIKRVDTGVVDVLTSLAPGTSAVVTMTLATPGVVTWTKHGLQANAPVKFTTTGALPTGLTAGTQYYVKTVSTANSFTVSATQGGAAIATSGSQSGVHTASSTPVMPANYTLSRRIWSLLVDGSAHWTSFTQIEDNCYWTTEVQDLLNSTTIAAATDYALTIPPGFVSIPNLSLRLDYTGAITNFGVGPGGSSGSFSIASGASGTVWMPVNTLASDTARQIVVTAGATNGTLSIFTIGFKDTRGRLG